MVSFWSLCISYPCFVHTVFMAWRSHTQMSQSRLCLCLPSALNVNAMQQWLLVLSSCKWVSLAYGIERSCNGFVWLALRRLSHSNMAWKIKTLHVGKRHIHASCASWEGRKPSFLTREHVSTLVPCPYPWQPSIYLLESSHHLSRASLGSMTKTAKTATKKASGPLSRMAITWSNIFLKFSWFVGAFQTPRWTS